MQRFVFSILAVAAAISMVLVASGVRLALRPQAASKAAAQPSAASWDQTGVPLPATINPPFAPASPWGRRLNPAGTVFADGYRAFYFDRSRTDVRPTERQTDAIGANFAWNSPQGVPSGRFGAYWVGTRHYPRETLQRIGVRLSRSTARIFVDGKLLAETNETATYDHRFAPGDHLIEVEYANDWHTTDFSVSLGDAYAVAGRATIADQVRVAVKGPYDLYFASVYEQSGGNGEPLAISLPRSRHPAVLWLNSYNPVDWRINAGDRKVLVVLASYEPGSTASGIPAEQVWGTRDYYPIDADRVSPCSGTGQLHLAAIDLQQLFGRSVTGHTVAHETSNLALRDSANGQTCP